MNNKHISRAWGITAIFLVLLGSCSHTDKSVALRNNNNSSILDIIENYFKVANAKVDGTFIFESNLTNNDPAEKNTVLAGGIFYDKAGNAQVGGGRISIGSHEMNDRGQGTYGFDKALPQQGLYGTNVTFKLTPPANHISKVAASATQASGASGVSSTPSGTITATVYSPLAINITNVAPRTQITLTPNTNTTLLMNKSIRAV